MKTPFIIYCLFSISLVGAQSYIPLIAENARWDETLRIYDSYTFIVEKYGHSFFLSGDTTINNVDYHTVYYQYMWEQVIDPYNNILKSTNLNEPSKMIGAIREDTASQKVYYLDFGEGDWTIDTSLIPSHEVLLYDFSLNVGDVTHIGRVPTERVDYVYYNTYPDGTVRKSLEVDAQKWIEGIGSTFGLFGPYRFDYWMYYASHELSCFSVDGHYFFRTPNADCDSVPEISPVSTLDIPSHEDKIQIFPNPASNRIQLEIVDLDLNIHRINMVNASGTEYPIHFKEIGRTLTIDISSFPSGIYVLNILLDNGQPLSEKIVVSR